MKTTRLRLAVLALALVASSFVGASSASAQSVSIRIGTPPPGPPPNVYRQWPPPYRNAVWIPGHHEWIGNRWVWVGGYYSYPPRGRSAWVSGRYRQGYYYPGYWR